MNFNLSTLSYFDYVICFILFLILVILLTKIITYTKLHTERRFYDVRKKED